MRYTLLERLSRCSADDGERKKDEEAVTRLSVGHVQSFRGHSTLVVDWTVGIQQKVGNHSNECTIRLLKHYTLCGKAKPPVYSTTSGHTQLYRLGPDVPVMHPSYHVSVRKNDLWLI
jgi:hypothetical protein